MKRHILIFLNLIALDFTVLAETHYVSLDGTNDAANRYNTWAGAATNIQWAINVATNGETVLVSGGTYYLTNQITINNGILLMSFSGSYADTVVNGNYPIVTSRCFNVASSGAIIDGFTITNGYAPTNNQHGGGAYISAGTLRNCLLTGNTVTNDGIGGGAYVIGMYGLVTNCILIGNTAFNYGGGIGAGTSGTVHNCHIMQNRVNSSAMYKGGGGAYLSGVNASLQNTVIISNTAHYEAGGVYMNINTFLRNCLIARNTSRRGGGIFSFMNNTAHSNKIENCTIVCNVATGGVYEGSGINGAYRGLTYLFNTIAYSNINQNTWGYDSITNISYSSCTISNSRTIFADSGNSTSSPAFADFSADNYHLTRGSPCVNSGLNLPWMTDSIDLDGKARIDKSGVVDKGCYEYQRRGFMVKMR